MAPGAPAVNPNEAPRPLGQKIMLGVVIFLGLLIFLGLGAVVVGVTMKARGHGGGRSAPAALVVPAMAPGSQIESMQVSGERLVLRLKTPEGEEIDIIDLQDGRIVSRIRTAPPEVPHE